MKNKGLSGFLFFAVAAICFIVAPMAQASTQRSESKISGVTIYTSPSRFNSATASLGTVTVVNFESATACTGNTIQGCTAFDGSFYSSNGITFSNPNGYPLYIAPAGLFWNSSNSLSIGRFPFDPLKPDEPEYDDDDLVMTFSAPVRAVGFDVIDSTTPSIEFKDSNGNIIAKTGLSSEYTSYRTFIGIVTTNSTIKEVNIIDEGNNGDDVNYDDVTFYPSSYEVVAPTVTTGSATNVTATSAALNGTVNANGLSTTTWFNYGITSGSYTGTSTMQSLSGTSSTAISATISGLSSSTTYYYLLAAQNSAGTSYGSEASFTTTTAICEATTISVDASSVTLRASTGGGVGVYVTVTGEDNCAVEGETVTATIDAAGKDLIEVSPVSAVTDANGQAEFTISAFDNAGNTTIVFQAGSLKDILKVSVTFYESSVFGFVNDEDELPLNGVTVRIPFEDSTETDEDGFYEISNLASGDYTLTYEKEGYQTQTQDINLKEREVKDLGTVTMEQVVQGKISGYVINIKGDPIESVRLKLKGIKTKVIKTASSDADGFFEFTDLDADTYVIFAKKKGYKKTQQKVVLGDGDSTEIEIEMKKTSKRVIEMVDDGQ